MLAVVLVCALVDALIENGYSKGAFVLDKVRRQTLPEEILRVNIGPDGRIWYRTKHPRLSGQDRPEFHTPGKKMSRGDHVRLIRKVIEQEFSKSTPHIYGVHPVLFESNGRVWFQYRDDTLFAYDGVRWIGYDTTKKKSAMHLISACANQAKIWGSCSTAEIDGSLFFPVSTGVYVYNNSSWSFQEVITDTLRARYRLRFRAGPKRTSAIAFDRGRPWRVWRWSAGTWRLIELNRNHVVEVCPAGKHGLWVLTNSHTIMYKQVAGLDQEKTRFQGLLADLHNCTLETEQKEIVERIIQCGSGIIPDIEHALTHTYDTRVLENLTQILESLQQSTQLKSASGYAFRWLTYLHHNNQQGQCFVKALGVRRGVDSVEDGLLILNEPGGPRFVPMPKAIHYWSPGCDHVFSADGTSVWLKHVDRDAIQIDLQTGRIQDVIENPILPGLCTVHPDGTVFLRSHLNRNKKIIAYRPEYPDTRDISTSSPNRGSHEKQ